VQHGPHAVGFVEAHLDEVVAAAERAELVRPAGILTDALADARMLLEDFFQRLLKPLRCVRARVPVGVLAEAHRHVAADLGEDPLQRAFVELVRRE
jgi:hypothetical protein